MNALQKLYIASHPLRISRYGAHTSLSISERVEIIDALTQTLGTTLGILRSSNGVSRNCRTSASCRCNSCSNAWCAPMPTTPNSWPVASPTWADTRTAALYSLNDTHDPQCFADCLSRDFQRERCRLRAVDALLRDYCECAIANKDNASKRFFEACTRHNARSYRC